MKSELADDLLSQAEQIGEFIGEDERRTYRLLETGQIPGFKMGGRWYARKSTLLEHIAKLEARAAARNHSAVSAT